MQFTFYSKILNLNFRLKLVFYLWLCLAIFQCTRHSYECVHLITNIEKRIVNPNYFLNYRTNDIELPWWEMQNCDLEQKSLFNEEREVDTKFAQMNTLGYDVPYADYAMWIEENAVNHTCGWKSWNAGYGQKVISLCLYGNKTEYWRNIDALLSRAVELYPGWYIRIYTTPSIMKPVLCPLLNSYPNLHICDITSLPPPLGDISLVHPAMWRFAPLSDILVDAVIFRDSDAMMLQREVDAVNDWLKSNKSVHSMRDHPSERSIINAGMWGARLKHDRRANFTRVLHTMFDKSKNHINKYGVDQSLPAKILWPVMADDALAHDSYNCEKYPNSIPFPTQRVNNTYIGNKDIKRDVSVRIFVACPIKCRPKDHKDWEYC